MISFPQWYSTIYRSHCQVCTFPFAVSKLVPLLFLLQPFCSSHNIFSSSKNYKIRYFVTFFGFFIRLSRQFIIIIIIIITFIIITIIYNSILCTAKKKEKGKRMRYLRCGNSLLNHGNISMFNRA